ncbi:zinc finger protein 808-like isoform X1 [Bradysia coprophila]|uniref:zinc finger protein 808-like isoform X1 n=1 Tax=Bradysia coprophila TaxID=38358 RepID=UPI00187D8461|nr:zinc finger protein 808-like isoform X1 [Bradysia coprophila]
MDVKWRLPKEIKQEEPVEYYLISSISDEQLNVALDTYTPQVDQLKENFPVQVKQECVEHIFEPAIYGDNDGADSVDPLEYVNIESHNGGNETSDYEPDSEYDDKDGENDTDEDYEIGSKKKRPSKTLQKNENLKRTDISIVEYKEISSKGPPYACNVCSLTFPIVKSLIAHRSIHKGKKFQCDLCKHVFKSKSHIYEHMKCHQEPQHCCPVCLKTFALKKSFIRHQMIHEEKQFECDICKKRFRQKGHVYEHMKTHRERVKHFHCEICVMSYYEQRTLNRHMKFAHSNLQRKRFRCPNTLCDKSYSSAPSFRMHACVDGRRPQDMLNTSCSQCNKRFFNKFELNRHVKRTHVTKPDNFRCNDCGRGFLYRYWDSYILHVAQKCAKLIIYECDYCARLLPSKAKLMEHFAGVHGIDNTTKKLDCPKCTKFFFTKNSLNYHMKKLHIDLKCTYCNLTLKSKSGRNLHQKHCIPKKTFEKYSQNNGTVAGDPNGGSSHACEICKCSFISKANLLEHQTEVHVEKNFAIQDDNMSIPQHSCSTCNLTFATALTLAKHRKRMHKNRKHFKCPTCNVTFGEKLYQQHFRRSKCKKKELPRYQCTVCARIFTRNTNLKKHFRKIHLNERSGTHFICDICGRSFSSKRSMLNHFVRGDHRNSLQCEFCATTFKHLSACWKHSVYCKSKP